MKRLLFIAFVGLMITSFAPAHAQIIKTSLNVIVRDDIGNVVPKATVKLYEKEEDYLKEQNPAAEGETDEKGFIRFKTLKPIAYYVLARTEEKDNAGGGEQTGKLEEKKINKVTIVIQ
jgi:hypothetical protein